MSVTTDSGKARFGQNGWLFLQRDTNDVIAQHEGRKRLSPTERSAFAGALRDRRKMTEDIGAEWLVLVAPDKEAVYADQLPPDVVPAPRRTIHDFLEIAEDVGVPVVYPLEELKAARSGGDVYPKTDAHWNQRGTYLVYQLVCEALAARGLDIDVVPPGSVQWREGRATGGLGGSVDPPISSAVMRAQLEQHRSRVVFDNRIHIHGRVLVFEQSSGEGPSCVVFGESMTNNLLLFLKESFRRLVFVHTSMMVREVLEHERPDVVLNVPLERFLIRVPDDAPGMDGLLKRIESKLRIGKMRPADGFLRGIPSEAKPSDVGQVPWDLG